MQEFYHGVQYELRIYIPIHCQYLKEKVHFTAEGLEYLKFKRLGVARSRQDQYMRFKLLKVIPSVLGDSKTVQGILETKKFQKVRKYVRTENILMPVTYYEFIGVIEKVRVKIIMKKSNEGPRTFCSIIPFLGTSTITPKRKLHSGNVVED